MSTTAADFGQFAAMVKVVSTLSAAALTIGLTWKGPYKWEPSESDLPRIALKFCGLLTSVMIGLSYRWLRYEQAAQTTTSLVIKTIIIACVCLFAYLFLVTVLIFKREIGSSRPEKIIGGFIKEKKAQQTIRRDGITVQYYFAGVGYDPDRVWPRWSRAIAKVLFVLVYLGMVSGGTMSLALVAILLLAEK